MKFIKRSLFGLLLLCVFALVAIWALTQMLDPAIMKDLIARHLSELTGEKVEIDGNVAWHINPKPGVNVKLVRIGKISPTRRYFLLIENLEFHLQVPPLLQGRLVFNELHMEGLQLRINADFNSSSKPPPPQKKPIKTLTTLNEPAEFAINTLILERGQLVIAEQHGNFTLNGIELHAQQVNLQGTPFFMQINTTLASAFADNAIQAVLHYEGNVQLDKETFKAPENITKNVQFNGQLQLEHLHINALNIERLSANAHMSPEEIRLDPCRLSLYGGESIGDISYLFPSAILSINQTANHLDANLLQKDFLGRELLGGSLDLSIHTTQNMRAPAWQNTLIGNGELSIREGNLYFVDFNQTITTSSAKIHALLSQNPQKALTTLEKNPGGAVQYAQGNTSFQLLSIPYQLRNSQFISNALLLQMDKLQLNGNGQINLVDGALSGKLSAKLTVTDPLLNKIQTILGGNIPLNISGTFRKPLIAPDAKQISPLVSNYLKKQQNPVREIQKIVVSPVVDVGQIIQDILD